VLGPDLQEGTNSILLKLVELGFLVSENGHQAAQHLKSRTFASVSPTLFRIPARPHNGPGADIAIIGIPYDGGAVVVDPGSRNAPVDIRLKSTDQEYRVDFATGKPMGWFEVDTQERILEGVTMSDWGNVYHNYGESADQLFERISAACAEVVEAKSFPVFLGGDHSVTYPVVEYLQREQPLHVIWLDAHTDYGDLIPGVCNNHKNVVRRILNLPNVEQVINVGHRGFTVSDKVNRRPPKFQMVTAEMLRRDGPRRVLDLLPADAVCYVSIDIDVLDPIYAPGTSTIVPGGLTPAELKDVLRSLGRKHKFIGFDLVEVNPHRDPSKMTLIQACHILAVAMSAAKSPARTSVGVQSDRTSEGI
jgi:agmatinase